MSEAVKKNMEIGKNFQIDFYMNPMSPTSPFKDTLARIEGHETDDIWMNTEQFLISDGYAQISNHFGIIINDNKFDDSLIGKTINVEFSDDMILKNATIKKTEIARNCKEKKMQELLKEQIKQAIDNRQGIIVLDPKNESSEYMQDIIEVAKKHDKLQNIICTPTSSVDDLKDVAPEIGQKILDNCNTSIFITEHKSIFGQTKDGMTQKQ